MHVFRLYYHEGRYLSSRSCTRHWANNSCECSVVTEFLCSQYLLRRDQNIAFPCLMFSKIVPAFNSDNISAIGMPIVRCVLLTWLLYDILGPLVLVAVVYELLGVAIAWLVKQFCWVPHRFRYGIIVAGGCGNYGDVREYTLHVLHRIDSDQNLSATAVIMSITGAAPFNPSTDQNLSVAYISAFILVFVVSFFH